jgi:integrase
MARKNKPIAPRSRNNFLSAIRTLFVFAAEREYLPVGYDHHEKVKFMADGEGEIEVYTADELERLLAAAPAELVPCIAIGAFAGLRSAEIERLDWKDTKLENDVILVREKTVKGERNKTGKRTVPVQPNLKLWLAPHAKTEGSVWINGHDYYYQAQRAAAANTKTDRREGVLWKHNGLRHSYISYRVRQTQDLPKVALEAGNSVQMIKKHYLEVELPDGTLITSKEAEAWFSAKPQPRP